MNAIYATLNADNVCVGVSSLSGNIVSKNMILIDNFDSDIVGMIYEDGEFREYKEPLPEPYTPTEGELLLMESQAMMYETITSNALLQSEVQAAIYEAILSKEV